MLKRTYKYFLSICFYRRNPPPQYNRPELNYARAQAQNTEPSSGATPMRYGDPNLINMGYKGVNVNPQHSPHLAHIQQQQQQQQPPQQQQQNEQPSTESVNRLEMSIPRPPYTATGSIDISNLSNLSHIVDRYQEERILAPTSSYYADKSLMFSKQMVTSASGMQMFSQPSVAMAYGHDMQPTSIYNRQMEMQGAVMNAEKQAAVQQQPPEKKSKRRKTSKASKFFCIILKQNNHSLVCQVQNVNWPSTRGIIKLSLFF